MRVLVVTVVHHPEDARIRQRQIASLLAAGHCVTYLAPHDGAPSRVDGLAHVDVPRAVGRRRLAAVRAAREILGTRGSDHDLVLLHDPELLLVLPGLDLPPVVWDVHEDLGAALVDKDWVPSPLQRPLRAAVRVVEQLAEHRVHLLLAEHGYQERMRRVHPVVPNVPPLAPSVGPAVQRDEVVHLGRVSRLRGADELVAVGAALRPHGITLHLIGPVDDDVRPDVEAAADRGDVVLHGFVPNDRALGMLDGAIAGLALLHDVPNYRVSLPTKVVEYLGAGIPAITTPLPEAVRVVDAAHAGAVVPFGAVDEVVDVIRTWRDDPALARERGARGRAAAETHWSWDAHAPAFVAQLERWAGTS